MPTNQWLGNALDVKQISTLTVGGTVEVGDLFRVTMNGKTIEVAATSTSTTTTATEIKTALAASTIPEFAEVTWTSSGAVVTGTGKTAGVPFTVTVTTVEAGGGAADAQTFTAATTTAATGKNFWNDAANWSLGTVPVNGDDVVIENSTTDILYGLDQNAVTLASLKMLATLKIGLKRNPGTYTEYRQRYLKIGITTLHVNCNSQRMNIDGVAVASTVNVLSTGTPEETDLEALLWKGTNAANVVNITKGRMGIALLAGETATVATLREGYQSNIAGDAVVRCGSSVTLTTIDKQGGTLTIESNATTLTQTEGTTHVNGAAAITTLVVRGGTANYNSTGTLGTATVSGTGLLNFANDMRPKTVTNPIEAHKLDPVNDPFGTVSNLRIDFNEVAFPKLGSNIRLTRGAVA